MKIRIYYPHSQVCLALIIAFALNSCNGKKEEMPAIPPETSPLSQQYIGFGIINVSYTRVTAEPNENSASPGHLRRGSVVSILERHMIKSGEKTESWVLVDGAYKGWLKESLLDVYDNELQARTASEAMNR